MLAILFSRKDINQKKFISTLQEGSNSENESDEMPKKTPSKPPPKRGKGKQRTESKASKGHILDLLSYQSASPSFATLSVVKKKRSGGEYFFCFFLYDVFSFPIPTDVASAKDGQSFILFVKKIQHF